MLGTLLGRYLGPTMALTDDDRRALLTRLAPAGTAAVDVVADAVDEGEELREIVVDAQGDVVAFTDRRALFVASGAGEVVPVGYDAIDLRRRVDTGLAIDVLIEGGRLILDVARGTFARLAVVGTGAPPARASWLPEIAPPPRVEPAPASAAVVPDPATSVPAPPVTSTPTSPSPAPAPAPARWGPSPSGPVPVPASPSGGPRPVPAPPGQPPPGWHPDPAGRHWWRWWDGVDWTEHVADGGTPFVDPLPPRP